MTLKDYLDENLISVQVEVASSEEAIRYLGQQLVTENYVRPKYIDAVWQREQDYPTGIENEGCNFAITHAEGGDVQKDGIAIAVLRNPVAFRRIDAPDETTFVQIVLMLAIATPDRQVYALRMLMKKLQCAETFQKIHMCKDAQEALSLFCADL